MELIMPRIRINIVVLLVMIAFAAAAYGSDDLDFGQCSPNGLRYGSPEAALAAKEFRKYYGKKVPYCPNYIADVTNLTLDKSELIAGFDIGPQAQVNVFTEYSDPENDVVTYAYLVSGGKIIGQGKKVVWDLTDLAPGTYTIVAGVNDGFGVCGEIKKRRIEILECAGCALRETE
jgi:hypothetical protein